MDGSWEDFVPTREDGEPVVLPPPAVADYHALFECLGWEFILKRDGGVLIVTSRFEPNVDSEGKVGAMIALSPALRRALVALLAAGDEDGPADPDPFLGRIYTASSAGIA